MSAAEVHSVKLPEMRRFFAAISDQIGSLPSGPAPELPIRERDLEQFFDAVSRRLKLAERQQRHTDRRLATGFNVFDLIEPDENRLSDILAWLLDPNGSHGQGGIFLALLLKKLGFRSETASRIKATVQREAPTFGIKKYRRRMDVLVEAKRRLIAIENKVDAMEQTDQVKDYLDHLRRCRRSGQSALIYLTPDARPPESLSASAIDRHRQRGELYLWSYQKDLLPWLDGCWHLCEAEKIRSFLSDFMHYIRSSLKRGTDAEADTTSHED